MTEQNWKPLPIAGDFPPHEYAIVNGVVTFRRTDHLVPTTDEALTDRLAELQRPVNGHRPYCLSNQPGDGACNCDMNQQPIPPTREQLADRLIERLRNSGGWPVDDVWQRWQNLFVEYDRDLAMLRVGADR